MKQAVNVAITGAAGQIGYALAFRVASGQMLGPDQPVNLHLLEIPQALPGLQGVVMELDDCAFPTLNKVLATDDAKIAFKDCHAAMLVDQKMNDGIAVPFFGREAMTAPALAMLAIRPGGNRCEWTSMIIGDPQWVRKSVTMRAYSAACSVITK